MRTNLGVAGSISIGILIFFCSIGLGQEVYFFELSPPYVWSISPSNPTTEDVIHIKGPFDNPYYLFSNDCIAQANAGFEPELWIGSGMVALVCGTPIPPGAICPLYYDPVNAVDCVFGPLPAGDWTFTADYPIAHYCCKNFTVRPALTVLTPNGGEYWAAGSNQEIIWESNITANEVVIEYSTDNGGGWQMVNTNTPNDGFYEWVVPVVDSQQCLVKVSKVGEPSVNDISDNVFTIYSLLMDINGDKYIDFFDYAIFSLDWQQSPDPCDPNNGDINKDLWVDFYDLYLLAASWLECFVAETSSPNPLDEAVDVNLNPVLEWSAGEGDISHDVYFGTDFNEVSDADFGDANVFMGNQTENFWDTNNYDANALEYGTTYFWRIDEIEEGAACIAGGGIWSFTTYGLPHQASNPDPANEAGDISTNVILSWSAGNFTDSHDVYFGTSLEDVNLADVNDSAIFMGNQTTTTWDTNNYDPCGLDYQTSYYWRIDERNGLGVTKGQLWHFTTGAEPNLDYGLVSWWQFDEGDGGTAYDSAGGNNGTLTGDTAWVAGKIGPNSLDFDGDGDYVNIPDDASLRFNQNDSFSICFWAKPTASGSIFGKYRVGGVHDVFGYLVMWEETISAFRIVAEKSYVGSTSVYTPDNSVPAGEWYFVVAVYENKDMNIYLNGQHAGSGTFAYDTGSTVPDHDATIGARRYDSVIDHYYTGSIDEVRIYNRVLIDEEVELLYEEGAE